MAFNIFISYSTKDGEIAKSIEKYFKQIKDTEPFLYDSQLTIGNLTEILIQRITQCNLFIVLYSKNSHQSIPVQHECAVARGAHRDIIIMLLDPEVKPEAMLTGINYLDCYDEQKMSEQLPRLYQYIANKSQEKATNELLVIGVLGVAAWWALSKRNREPKPNSNKLK